MKRSIVLLATLFVVAIGVLSNYTLLAAVGGVIGIIAYWELPKPEKKSYGPGPSHSGDVTKGGAELAEFLGKFIKSLVSGDQAKSKAKKADESAKTALKGIKNIGLSGKVEVKNKK